MRRSKPNVKQGATGFSVTYVRAKTGKGAALHRHATEEVFIPIKGPWQVFWLEGDHERTVDLDEGDVVNVPTGIYRGFRSLSDRPDALMMAVGGPDAGKVDWHPTVLRGVRGTGLSSRRRRQSDHREAGGVRRGNLAPRAEAVAARSVAGEGAPPRV